MAACPPGRPVSYYLKCRISQAVTPQVLLEEFEVFDLLKLHFPKPDHCGRMGQAFLEFSSSASRRRAHTKNENYIHDCQLQLHYSSQHSLREAVVQNNFSTYEMSSYKMQRQVALGIEQVFIASLSGGLVEKTHSGTKRPVTCSVRWVLFISRRHSCRLSVSHWWNNLPKQRKKKHHSRQDGRRARQFSSAKSKVMVCGAVVCTLIHRRMAICPITLLAHGATLNDEVCRGWDVARTRIDACGL